MTEENKKTWQHEAGNQAGPIQIKRVNKAIAKVLQYRNATREIYNIGGRESVSIMTMPFSPDTNPVPRELYHAVGDKYNWTISRSKVADIIADLEAAAVKALESVPTIDKRTTPEQDAEQAEKQARNNQQRAEHDARIKANHAAILAKRPPNAQAAIVAELDVDACDCMTDYFHHTTSRHVVIGWRTGSKDDFRQMRAAAARFPETAHLGTGRDVWRAVRVWDHDQLDWNRRKGQTVLQGEHSPTFTTEAELRQYIAEHPADTGTEWDIRFESVEHREKYSMGSGYYLKAGHNHSSGWRVHAMSLKNSGQEFSYCYQELEDGLPTETEPARTTARTAPATGGKHSAAVEIQKHFHTKQGKDFWLCVLADRVERDEFERLRDSCKAAGGWYSKQWGRTPGGFAFEQEADAEAWAAKEFPAPDQGPDGTPQEHDPAVCGCEYAGNNAWTCGHLDQEPAEPAPANGAGGGADEKLYINIGDTGGNLFDEWDQGMDYLREALTSALGNWADPYDGGDPYIFNTVKGSPVAIYWTRDGDNPSSRLHADERQAVAEAVMDKFPNDNPYLVAFNQGTRPYSWIATGIAKDCLACKNAFGCNNNTNQEFAEAIESQEVIDDGKISSRPCGFCGTTLQGNRYKAHGWRGIDTGDKSGERVHLEVCGDCVAFLANGEVPENWQQHPPVK